MDSERKKSFKQSEIGLIPLDWTVANLGELGELKNGVNFSRDDQCFVVIRDRLLGTMNIEDYWKGFLDWCNDTLVGNGTINAEDLKLIHVTDDVEELARIIHRVTAPLGIDRLLVKPKK